MGKLVSLMYLMPVGRCGAAIGQIPSGCSNPTSSGVDRYMVMIRTPQDCRHSNVRVDCRRLADRVLDDRSEVDRRQNLKSSDRLAELSGESEYPWSKSQGVCPVPPVESEKFMYLVVVTYNTMRVEYFKGSFLIKLRDLHSIGLTDSSNFIQTEQGWEPKLSVHLWNKTTSLNIKIKMLQVAIIGGGMAVSERLFVWFYQSHSFRGLLWHSVSRNMA